MEDQLIHGIMFLQILLAVVVGGIIIIVSLVIASTCSFYNMLGRGAADQQVQADLVC